MIGVIDTSALIRLFIPNGPIPEGLEAFFKGVELGRNTAIAPELLIAEASNVVLKKNKAGELTPEESQDLLTDLLAMPIRTFPHLPFAATAFDIAQATGLTLYDAMYLALSQDQGGLVYSADEKLQKVAHQLGLSCAGM